MGSVVVHLRFDEQRCKGCSICVSVCPKGVLALGEHINSAGYNPVVEAKQGCNGCGMCAWMCPDLVISIYKEMGA